MCTRRKRIYKHLNGIPRDPHTQDQSNRAPANIAMS